MSVPRARQFWGVRTERVGEGVVMFVEETMHYHSLSGRSFEVWMALDGKRSIERVAELVYGDASEANVGRTLIAVGELVDADLVVDGDAPSLVNRRRLARAAAVAAFGGFVLPAVTSITAPRASAAFSFCGEKDNGTGCGPSDPEGCDSCCCCMWGASQGTCADRSACTYYCLGDF